TTTPAADNGADTASESFTYRVTDANGNTTTGTLNVTIVDDVPTAHDDAASPLSEGALLTVTAANGVLSNDVAGADGASVVGVQAGSNTASPLATGVGATINGAYGTLTLHADGSYEYQSNANALAGAATDVFAYTLQDGDGDTSTTTLTINLSDSGLVAPAANEAVVYENALDTVQDGADLAAGTVTGSLGQTSTGETAANNQLNASGGVGDLTYSLADGSSTASGNYGLLHLNANGSYTYTLTHPYTTTPAADNGADTASESFTYRVTDANGNTTTGTLNVTIVDDVPTAH
ncbi:Ig-like domain-containing protein, partial [Legionella santicrucis]|uniref:Ig-like domain-containing protein n=1 Tax=Legionella santicrucis TaxID=45074 RepID=UPI001A955EC5